MRWWSLDHAIASPPPSLKLYSPAGARLAGLWPMALLDGGAHHGFGARRGAPLVVVWEI